MVVKVLMLVFFFFIRLRFPSKKSIAEYHGSDSEATSKIGKTCLQCSKKSRWLRAFKTLSREWFNTKVSEFQSWKQQSSLFKFILLVPVFVTKRGNSKQSFYITEAKERIWSSKISYLIKGINIRFCTCFVLVSCWKSLVKLGMHIIRNSITWN